MRFWGLMSLSSTASRHCCAKGRVVCHLRTKVIFVLRRMELVLVPVLVQEQEGRKTHPSPRVEHIRAFSS